MWGCEGKPGNTVLDIPSNKLCGNSILPCQPTENAD